MEYAATLSSNDINKSFSGNVVYEVGISTTSQRIKARYNVLCENMVHRRGFEPWSPVFKADVIATTLQANVQ